MQGYFDRPNWLHTEYHQIDWNQTDVLELEPKIQLICYVWTTLLASPV